VGCSVIGEKDNGILMALSTALMVPEFIEIFSTPSLEPSMSAIRIVDAVSRYLAAGNNVAFGSFVCWGYPYPQMIQCFSVPKPDARIFAIDFTAAIISGLAGLYTTFQIKTIPPGPVMLPMMMAAVSKHNLSSIPFAIEVASAIHAQATSTIITVSDPKLLGAVYAGPFF
jgi:hypothetical protein